jgi:hypothetical protein
MRVTKLALMFGLVSLAFYGCGDSGDGSKKTDSGSPTGTNTTTKTSTSTATNTATTTPTGTSTSTATPTGTSTSTATPTGTGTSTQTATSGVDAGTGNSDASIGNPADGGGSADGGAITPGLDGGNKIDGTATVDGGTSTIDASSAVDAGGKDGGSVADAPLASDGPVGSGTCNYPQCYVDLVKNCVPQGACVLQTTTGTTSSSTNICYDNGVKTINATDFSNPAAMTMTITTKNGSAVCYSMVAPLTLGSTTGATFTLKDGSGTTVGTLTSDLQANTTTITCVGAAPVVVPYNCDSTHTDAGSGAACTTGTCAP